MQAKIAVLIYLSIIAHDQIMVVIPDSMHNHTLLQIISVNTIHLPKLHTRKISYTLKHISHYLLSPFLFLDICHHSDARYIISLIANNH